MEFFTEAAGKTLFLHLHPGDGLMEGIKAACEKAGVKGGTVTSCIGSLKKTAYTYVKSDSANASGVAYRDTIVTDLPNEVICAQGTVGLRNGEVDVHLHALMCDVDGKIFAGHMMPGCAVCVTMEISIAIAEAGELFRDLDPVMKLPVFQFVGK